MANEAQVRKYLDPDEPDYEAAAAALGPDALPAIDALVRGADDLLASKAAYLASMIPHADAVWVLEQAARSNRPLVRVAAAAGLQKRADASLDVVEELLKDTDVGVRKVAARAAQGMVAKRSAEAGKREVRQGAVARPRKAQLVESGHGGGFSEDTSDESEHGAGYGGGGRSAFPAPEERDSGGGGDLGGPATSALRSRGAPDGGGSIEGGAMDGTRAVPTHGGGSL